MKGTNSNAEDECKKVAVAVSDAANVGKRSADSSPEGMPTHKRSVFKQITNITARKDQPLTMAVLVPTVCTEKRITRSRIGLTNAGKENEKQAPQHEPRKSKRLSDKKETAVKSFLEYKDEPAKAATQVQEPSCESHETSYETAEESPSSSSAALLSTSKSSSSSVEGNKLMDSVPRKQAIARLLPVVPKGVFDFDAETAMDPFSVPLYAQDIFDHFKRREVQFLSDKYLRRQTDITRSMRSILVDWMAEVQESFELNHESLYLAVKMVDLYLSRQMISKNSLQLLGSTAMLVAAKFDERSPPVIDDFLYICDDAYDRDQLLRMEIRLLKVLDFDLGIPLSYSFLRRYARCSKQTMELLTLARYILELSLLEYDMVDIPDSLIAAASLSLALQMKKQPPWSATLEHFSGYKLPELTDLIHRLNSMLMTVGQRNLNTIPTKYSHKVFFEVAKIPPLDILST